MESSVWNSASHTTGGGNPTVRPHLFRFFTSPSCPLAMFVIPVRSRLVPSLSEMSLFLSFMVGAASIVTHLLFFKRGEHHLYPIRYIQALALVFATSIVALTHCGAHPWKESVNLSSSI